MVYELVFFYWDDNPENDDYVIVAVYSSYELAEKGLEKFAEQPRFKGKKDAFYICDYKINEESGTWSEGFFSPSPTYFGIDLLGEYRMRKYEGEKIGICIKGESKDFFVLVMHDYQDFERCTVLRNTELNKMYCFDKKKQSIILETNSSDEFYQFLKNQYDVNEIKWSLIDDEK